jgi:hypothetical protein
MNHLENSIERLSTPFAGLAYVGHCIQLCGWVLEVRACVRVFVALIVHWLLRLVKLDIQMLRMKWKSIFSPNLKQ